MPPPEPAVGAQAPAGVQRASNIASIQPSQAEGPAVAAAAVAWQPGRGILEVYPAGTAGAVSQQREPESGQACEEVLHVVVVRAEPGSEEESLACVQTLSPFGMAQATGSGWGTAMDLRPELSRGRMVPWERPVKAVRC